MSKNNNIIKINGKHYDVNTGAALTMASTVTISDITPGNSRKPSTTHLSRPSVNTGRRPVAANTHSHAPQPAKTLMRAALHKPPATHKHAVTSHGRTDMPTKLPTMSLTPKLAFTSIDGRRLSHAKAIPKSKLINHFNNQPALATLDIPSIAPTTTTEPHPTSPRLSSIPRTDFLQAAINRSTSHLQPAHKLPRSQRAQVARRLAAVSGATLSVLLLVGIVGYQNIANLRLHLASSRAGFAASLPAYQAAGFSLGDISSTPGEVAAKFITSNQSGRHFSLTEKPSGWDSVSLRDLFVAPIDKNFRTVEAKGQTIYLYGQNSATWVSGEIWYVVTGDGSLSDQQLIKLASSI